MPNDVARASSQESGILARVLRRFFSPQGAAADGVEGPLVQGAVSAASPVLTDGLTAALSLTAAGDLRVTGSPAIATAAEPTLVEAATVPLSVTLDGRLRTSSSDTPETADPAWNATADPGPATQATVTRASAGAGRVNVCTSISVSLAIDDHDVAPEIVRVVVRNGAAGAGAIIWSGRLALPAVYDGVNIKTKGGCAQISVGGMNLVGSAATAMTIETTAATPANVCVAVNMSGYTREA